MPMPQASGFWNNRVDVRSYVPVSATVSAS